MLHFLDDKVWTLNINYLHMRYSNIKQMSFITQKITTNHLKWVTKLKKKKKKSVSVLCRGVTVHASELNRHEWSQLQVTTAPAKWSCSWLLYCFLLSETEIGDSQASHTISKTSCFQRDCTREVTRKWLTSKLTKLSYENSVFSL